jgi:hypothetical protein
MIFLILRDGSGFVQVGVFGELAKKYNIDILPSSFRD